MASDVISAWVTNFCWLCVKTCIRMALAMSRTLYTNVTRDLKEDAHGVRLSQTTCFHCGGKVIMNILHKCFTLERLPAHPSDSGRASHTRACMCLAKVLKHASREHITYARHLDLWLQTGDWSPKCYLRDTEARTRKVTTTRQPGTFGGNCSQSRIFRGLGSKEIVFRIWTTKEQT